MIGINDVVSFLIEILSLALLCSWAYSLPSEGWQKILLALVAFAVFALIWALFFSPKAKYQISGNLYWILKFLLLLFPFTQFISKKPIYLIISAIAIFINLLLQSK
ncbi:putative membrane protein [Peptoniphilus sp. ING2-D1G]|nr:putative membrane protein [Peptoniphilus sp. ING2-D1G]